MPGLHGTCIALSAGWIAKESLLQNRLSNQNQLTSLLHVPNTSQQDHSQLRSGFPCIDMQSLNPADCCGSAFSRHQTGHALSLPINSPHLLHCLQVALHCLPLVWQSSSSLLPPDPPLQRRTSWPRLSHLPQLRKPLPQLQAQLLSLFLLLLQQLVFRALQLVLQRQQRQVFSHLEVSVQGTMLVAIQKWSHLLAPSRPGRNHH